MTDQPSENQPPGNQPPESKRPRNLSRRSLLLGGSAAVVVGAATGGLGYFAGRSATPVCEVCTPSDRAWRNLKEQLSGRLLRPDDAGYRKLAQPNNLRYDCVQPQGIAHCRSDQDLAAAISWCRDHDMPFAIRSGGHSYAGYSTTYGLLFDLGAMNSVTFDRSTGLMTVAGGARNSAVSAALSANSATITHGRCPTVGAAAFFLGGGIGFNMRRMGLGCDHLVRAALVTAEGKRVEVSDTSNPELFWALRGGGGGNFGVSTSFTLKTHPVNDLTIFKIKWTGNAEAVTEALLPALDRAPQSLGSRLSLGAITAEQRARGVDVTLDLLGQFAGSRDDLLDILRPAYMIAKPADAVINTTQYWQGQESLSEYQDPVYYQERSAFINRAVDSKALVEGFRWLRDGPGTGEYCDLRFFQTGGAMNTTAADATAFVHRDSQWLMVVGLYWNEKDNASPTVMRKAHAWQNGLYQAMLPFTGGGAYLNFPDPSLADWRRSYYGANLDRLSRIKAAVDPTNVFQFGQAI